MKTLVFVLFLFGCCCGNNVKKYYGGNLKDLLIIDSIMPEEPCLLHGGICTIAADCPAEQLVEQQGLCPIQRGRGVECCYGQSVKETRCQKKGGECYKKNEYCNPILVFQNATDCPKDNFCCIMVN